MAGIKQLVSTILKRYRLQILKWSNRNFTDSELRHTLFLIALASAEDIDVLASFCQGVEKSLSALSKQWAEEDG